MKFDFEKYKDQKVVMHCKTEEEAKDFCRVMDEAGLRWVTGERYTNVLEYERYRRKTCYQFNCGGFASKEFFVEEGYEILEWSDFMNSQSKQFTKSDLRNGDVCVQLVKELRKKIEELEDQNRMLAFQNLTSESSLENITLRAALQAAERELMKVTAERDAAVERVNHYAGCWECDKREKGECAMPFYKNECDEWEWRGLQEDKNEEEN